MRFRSSFWHKTLNKVSFTVVFIEKMSQTQRKTIYCLNQFLREKHQEKKNEIKIVNKKQPFFFNLCDMATSFDSWNWWVYAFYNPGKFKNDYLAFIFENFIFFGSTYFRGLRIVNNSRNLRNSRKLKDAKISTLELYFQIFDQKR